jgi:hypothetical protein
MWAGTMGFAASYSSTLYKNIQCVLFCDVSYFECASAVYRRTPSSGWCLMLSFLFLSQWRASSTSHRRDRRKRLLGCGSRDPGCGNGLGGLWCRGEGIVNQFVSKQHQLLCIIKLASGPALSGKECNESIFLNCSWLIYSYLSFLIYFFFKCSCSSCIM